MLLGASSGVSRRRVAKCLEKLWWVGNVDYSNDKHSRWALSISNNESLHGSPSYHILIYSGRAPVGIYESVVLKELYSDGVPLRTDAYCSARTVASGCMEYRSRVYLGWRWWNLEIPATGCGRDGPFKRPATPATHLRLDSSEIATQRDAISWSRGDDRFVNRRCRLGELV